MQHNRLSILQLLLENLCYNMGNHDHNTYVHTIPHYRVGKSFPQVVLFQYTFTNTYFWKSIAVFLLVLRTY